jgi:hydrogenase maturation protease
MKILVLGIGQSLRGDDAAGLEAVRLWREKYPQTASRVRVETSELPGLGLLDTLEGMDVAVIVDAIQSKASGGMVIRLGMEELASFTPETGSAHGWGAAETLRLGRLLYPVLAECQVILIGITGDQFDMGTGLSPEVEQALGKAVEMVENEAGKWLLA